MKYVNIHVLVALTEWNKHTPYGRMDTVGRLRPSHIAVDIWDYQFLGRENDNASQAILQSRRVVGNPLPKMG